MSDKIEPHEGGTVIRLGPARLSSGRRNRPWPSCRHLDVTYDQVERRIWCDECQTEVEPFDMLMSMVNFYNDENLKLERRQKELKEAEAHSLHLIAAKNIETAWRSHTMVPCCPSCGDGLLPEDFKRQPSMINKQLAKRALRCVSDDE
jgi:ribosomal protein S27E